MTIEGNTNVLSHRSGSGSVDGLAAELGRFVVVTMDVPWRVTKDRLGGRPEQVVMVESMEVDVIDRQAAAVSECDTIVGVGGGQAMDLAKYIAWKRGLRMVSVPTVLSVNAFVTPAAGIRRNHEVEYVGITSPDPLVIDYDLVRTAPNDLNIAGVGDILSIHTASFDWCLAAAAGRSEFEFRQSAVDKARAILADLMAVPDEIRRCTDTGLQAIVDGYMRINTVCLAADHYRIEEGSEHYLFYELEERLKRPFVHGHIIGLGICLLSRLQRNEPERITAFMDEVQLKYQPADMSISRMDLTASLANLAEFVRRRPHLWYTVINEHPISAEWIDETLSQLNF